MRFLLLALLTAVGSATGFAQVKYVDAQYPVIVDDLRTYGENFSYLNIFLGIPDAMPEITPLNYRTFRPDNDDTERPVVVISHTGSYMPIPFNGGLTGGINDRAVIELASRFAARGYVVVTPENRAGWATQSRDIDVQTSTLLLASLRGSQDMHMMRRYLSNTVANEDNFLGIDSSRVMILGLGTGGYNALNSNFLDSADEVNRLSKFINPSTQELYYNPMIDGDVYGVEPAATNNPQWTEHANGWTFVANLGGAMGDSSWIDGRPIEAPVVGMMSTEDLNAPFGIESIQVPTTMNTVLQDAPGGRIVVEIANEIGLNDIMDTTNQRLLAIDDPVTERIQELSDVPFVTPIQGFQTTLATENFYPFLADVNTGIANRYNWIDTATQGPAVRAFIAATNFPLSYAQLLGLEQQANNTILDQANAARYQDTIMQFLVPRAYAAMQLNDLAVSTLDLKPQDVELVLSPNPTRDEITVQVSDDYTIESIRVLNLQGAVVQELIADNTRVELDLSGQPAGVYYAFVTTDRGVTAQRFMKQ